MADIGNVQVSRPLDRVVHGCNKVYNNNIVSTRKAKVVRSLRQCAPLQRCSLKNFLCMSLITFMYA
jgi:hypothetical protein